VNIVGTIANYILIKLCGVWSSSLVLGEFKVPRERFG